MPTARNKGAIEPLADGSFDFADVLDMIRTGTPIRLVEPEQDKAAVAAEILERTLGATSADDIFDEGTNVEGMIGRPFYLREVRFRNQDEGNAGGLGIYALMFGNEPDGHSVTISSGATKIVVKCIKALQLDALPRWVKLTSDTTAAGNDVYDLLRVLTEAAFPEKLAGTGFGEADKAEYLAAIDAAEALGVFGNSAEQLDNYHDGRRREI
jgi:hypothetical protein